MAQDSSGENESRPSKSQLKREARALFELGRELVSLDRSTLDRMPLEERLRDAVEAARKIKSHIAHKRQLQRIAGILRTIDPEPLRAALEARQIEARQLTIRHHRVEAWRDRLLADGDTALQELLAQFQVSDGQALRTLIRNARREAERGKPPVSARKLFRLLRDIDETHPLPPA